MENSLKKTKHGRKFLLATVAKLFEPDRAPILSMLKLLNLDCIAEVAANIKIFKLKKGSFLPTLKKGMFALLEGNLEVKTHWKVSEGM
jgi:hypothetical protein